MSLPPSTALKGRPRLAAAAGAFPSRPSSLLALWALWLGALSALPLSASCSRGTAASAQGGGEPKTAVRASVVQSVPVRERGEYLATLRSRRQVAVQPQIDGQVTQILVTAGARVDAGDALVQIDPARQAALVSSETRTRQARQASLRYLEEQSRRMEALYQGGAVSKQELLQARSAYESAQAEVAALGAQVQQQAVQLKYYRVVAPIAGVVGDIPVRVGDRVTPATLLTTLDSGAGLEAYISLPVERAAAARIGAEVELLDERDVVRVRTQVSFIAPSATEDTQGVLVKALLSDSAEPAKAQPGESADAAPALRPGQVLRARLTFGEHKGPAVPVVSVTRLAGQHFAYVLEGEGESLRARQRPITVGEILPAPTSGAGSGDRLDLYEVRSGLKAGERVVISGIQKLHDQSPVSLEAEPAAAPGKPEAKPDTKPQTKPEDGAGTRK